MPSEALGDECVHGFQNGGRPLTSTESPCFHDRTIHLPDTGLTEGVVPLDSKQQSMP